MSSTRTPTFESSRFSFSAMSRLSRLPRRMPRRSKSSSILTMFNITCSRSVSLLTSNYIFNLKIMINFLFCFLAAAALFPFFFQFTTIKFAFEKRRIPDLVTMGIMYTIHFGITTYVFGSLTKALLYFLLIRLVQIFFKWYLWYMMHILRSIFICFIWILCILFITLYSSCYIFVYFYIIFLCRLIESSWFTWVAQSNHIVMDIHEETSSDTWFTLQVYKYVAIYHLNKDIKI